MIEISKTLLTELAIITAVAAAITTPAFAGEVRAHHHPHHGASTAHRGGGVAYAAPYVESPPVYAPVAPAPPPAARKFYNIQHDWQLSGRVPGSVR